MYFFQADLLFGIENKKFWPVLANIAFFVAYMYRMCGSKLLSLRRILDCKIDRPPSASFITTIKCRKIDVFIITFEVLANFPMAIGSTNLKHNNGTDQILLVL